MVLTSLEKITPGLIISLSKKMTTSFKEALCPFLLIRIYFAFKSNVKFNFAQLARRKEELGFLKKFCVSKRANQTQKCQEYFK